jgi:hypothetical protein
MLTTDLFYISLILQTFSTIGDGAKKKFGGMPPLQFYPASATAHNRL